MLLEETMNHFPGGREDEEISENDQQPGVAQGTENEEASQREMLEPNDSPGIVKLPS
jgi:hypothetical protein